MKAYKSKITCKMVSVTTCPQRPFCLFCAKYLVADFKSLSKGYLRFFSAYYKSHITNNFINLRTCFPFFCFFFAFLLLLCFFCSLLHPIQLLPLFYFSSLSPSSYPPPYLSSSFSSSFSSASSSHSSYSSSSSPFSSFLSSFVC